MKFQTMLLILLALTVSLAMQAPQVSAQTIPFGRVYQQLTPAERSAFITEQARRIGREISGSEYEFTADFVGDIQQAVNQYARRVGTNGSDLGKRDLRQVFERGQAQAPTMIAAFRARNVSPLIGLYIPWIESEYVNLESQKPMGAIGMYQFLPQTGERLGLSPQDLLDVGKSADAAARYIRESMGLFSGDPMKETMALLSYNRGGHKTAKELKSVINEQNKQCSICALTADRGKLDKTFRQESVYYVPLFFAAAIIGENPQAFGLPMQPLSSY